MGAGAEPQSGESLKTLTSLIEGIGGWLRYQDGKATALSAIVGVGLLDAIGLAETHTFQDQTASWHNAVVVLFWVSLVAADIAILLFASAIIPNFPKPGEATVRNPCTTGDTFTSSEQREASG